MLTIKINGVEYNAKKGSTILQVCQDHSIFIPTLCNHPDIPPAGNCGICVVKVNGSNFALSCSTKIAEGMIIETETQEVKNKALEALNSFSDMPLMPFSKEIEELWSYLRPTKPVRTRPAEKSNGISFDPKLCVNCGRCARICGEVQCMNALDESSHLLSQNDCIQCGQCTTVCPTGALQENISIPKVIQALSKGKTLILQISPSSRVSCGECFGDPIGTDCTGKIISAARIMGFRYVFDVNYGADLTTIEESNELLERMDNGGVLPMFTSCCPAWINFVEKIRPELIPNLSTAKSPHLMCGAAVKNVFAEQKQIEPSKIFIVSLMPCTAKKDEIAREINTTQDVDVVITSREFGKMCKEFDIDWASLPNGKFDQMMSESSGGSALFGVTGGIMESSIRYIAKKEGTEPPSDHSIFRKKGGIRTADIKLGKRTIKMAICDGIANARDFIESGDFENYTFIEVTACPMGCIGGGGQPKLRSHKEVPKRALTLYSIDANKLDKPTALDNAEAEELFRILSWKGNELKNRIFHTKFRKQDNQILAFKRVIGNVPMICYGSATGRSTRFAQTFAQIFQNSPVAMNKVDIQAMIRRGTALFICSTFGDAEFPHNAQKFAEILRKGGIDLTGLRVAVCALGSSLYPKFCAAGRELDSLLKERGAERLLPLYEIDTSEPDRGELAMDKWIKECTQKLGLKINSPGFESKFNITITKNPDDAIHKQSLPPNGFETAVLMSNTILTPEGIMPRMHRYQLKLPSKITYQAGDVLAILPQNDPAITKATIEELGLDPDDIVNITPMMSEGPNIIPPRVTVQQLFSQYIDLNCIPSRKLISLFLQFATDEFVKERLEKLSNESQPHFFEDFVRDTNVGEVILEFAHTCPVPLSLLLTYANQIHPRLYCIASAPSGRSRDVDLLVSDHMFGPDRNRPGLCTSFLQRFGVTKIYVRAQKGCVRYPKDPTTPLLMCAFGCGIAPMLSLLQHRENTGGELGPAYLYFGCRYKNSFPILDSTLQEYIDSGSLQQLKMAYSREGSTKVYVNDVMEKDAKTIWSIWKNKKCTLFFSGSPQTGFETIKATLVKISMEEGSMTREEAEDFFAAHAHFVEMF